jgi:small-conductance mechanosensitive channel
MTAFERAYPGDLAGVRIVERVLDPHQTGSVTREWLVQRCVTLYRERKNLSQGVSDLNSVVRALDSFLNVATGFIMFFVVLVLFSEGDYAQVTVSLGTTLLAFSFIFSDTAKNVFNSFVFLFIRHPYDVGKCV